MPAAVPKMIRTVSVISAAASGRASAGMFAAIAWRRGASVSSVANWSTRASSSVSSGSHVFDSVASLGDEDMSISFEISATDYKFPEFSWAEILDCTREATGILAKYLDGYILTKGLTPEQLAELRAAANPFNPRTCAKNRASQ